MGGPGGGGGRRWTVVKPWRIELGRDVSVKLLKDDIEDEGEGSGEGETGRECLGLGGSGFVDWCFFSLFRSGMRPETLQERCEAI